MKYRIYINNLIVILGMMIFVLSSFKGTFLWAQETSEVEEADVIEKELEESNPSEQAVSTEEDLDAMRMKEEVSSPAGKKNKNGNSSYIIFDDRKLLDGYKKKYSSLSKEILLEMIKDYNLSSYRSAAAVMVFNEKYSKEVVSKEKRRVEKILLRRLARSESPFLQVEIMSALCSLDRYRYFKSMVPGLIQKLNHYNSTVNEIAFEDLEKIIKDGSDRAREARIVFNTLRKILFLSRRRLIEIKEPGPKLSRKLKLLRWSIKVLGKQELRRLPEEVLHLL